MAGTRVSRKRGDLAKKRYPILEFDPSRRAIIEPGKILQATDVSRHCVVCFFREVIDKLRAAPGTREVVRLKSEAGEEPLLEIAFHGKRLAVFHPGVGAPLAAALLEEVIAHGCTKFVACGSAGVLDREIAGGHVVVPTSAVRDEGTSYHYPAPGREVEPSPEGVAAVVSTLESRKCPILRARRGRRTHSTAKPPPRSPSAEAKVASRWNRRLRGC